MKVTIGIGQEVHLIYLMCLSIVQNSIKLCVQNRRHKQIQRPKTQKIFTKVTDSRIFFSTYMTRSKRYNLHLIDNSRSFDYGFHLGRQLCDPIQSENSIEIESWTISLKNRGGLHQFCKPLKPHKGFGKLPWRIPTNTSNRPDWSI